MRSAYLNIAMAISCIAGSASGAELTPLAPEFIIAGVNPQFGQGWVWPDSDDDGNFVVGYSSNKEILARMFDRSGNPLGLDFPVNTTFTNGDQNETFVARDPISGDFLVCYSDRHDNDGHLIGAFGRFYRADGTPYGADKQLNITTVESQFEPNAAFQPGGNVMVVWTDDGVIDGSGGCIGRIFTPNGTPVTGEFLINTPALTTQIDPTVAASRDGKFVVAFVDASGATGEPREVLARMFDQNGSPLGGQFLVNSSSAGMQREPYVAMDADGDFVVVWHDESGTDGSGFGVFARLFDSAGTPKGPQFVISQTTAGDQRDPYVEMDYSGNFVVVWESNQSGNFDVYLRRFDRSGEPLCDETVVHEGVTGDQLFAKCSISQNGQRIFVTWTGTNTMVYGRVFHVDTISSDSTPTIGDTVTVDIELPGMGGETYFLLPSRGTTPPLDVDGGRELDLKADAMLLASATAPDAPPFTQLTGTLDANGRAQATFTVPNESTFYGSSIHFAAFTLPSSSLNLNDLQNSQLTGGVDYLTDVYDLALAGPPRVLPGQIVQGMIDSIDEEDWMSFEAVKGETIKIQPLPIDPLTQSGVKLFKMRIEVVDDNGDVVDVLKAKIPEPGAKAKKVKLKVKQSGRYSFHISGNKGAVGNYRFALTHKLPKAAKDTTKKLKIKSGGDAKKGLLAAASAMVSVTAKPVQGAAVPTLVEILDPAGNPVTSAAEMSFDGAVVALNDIALTLTGKYKVRVVGAAKAKYKLSVTPLQPSDESVLELP